MMLHGKPAPAAAAAASTSTTTTRLAARRLAVGAAAARRVAVAAAVARQQRQQPLLRSPAAYSSSSSSSGGDEPQNTLPAVCDNDHATTTTTTTTSSPPSPPSAATASPAAAAAAAAAAAVLLLALPAAVLAPPPADAQPRMTPDEQNVISVFKKAKPSVVNVTNLTARRDSFTTNILEVPQGAGSGFIWDKEGHVITNVHVVSDATDIQVTTLGGAQFSARVVGQDPDKDIAVLRLVAPLGPQGANGQQQAREQAAAAAAEPLGAPAVPPPPQQQQLQRPALLDDGLPPPPPISSLQPLARCSSSADLVVGQKAIAIGSPFGLDQTLTVGVVSGTGREITSISGRPIQDAVQTDASINPGNSGGPLLDSGGCLIGINTAIFSPSGASSGVGFAIPVDVVNSSVRQIIEHGRVVRPVLGISFAPDASSEQLGVKGILVLSARDGGPASKAGVQGTSRDEYGRLVLGDIIIGVGEQRIRTSSDLYRVLDKARVGDALDLEVLRGNSRQRLTAVLEANT